MIDKPKIKNKEFSFAEKLIEIATDDLKAAKTLYDAKLYPQSVSSFQQSVEKLNKAFGLLSKNLELKELKNKVGHRTINIYQKIAKEQLKKFEGFKGLAKKYESFNELIPSNFINKEVRKSKKFLKTIKKLKDNPEEILKVSREEISNLLKEIKGIEGESKKFDENDYVSKFTDKELEAIRNKIKIAFGSVIKQHPEQGKEITQALESMSKDSILNMIKLNSRVLKLAYPLSAALIGLSILTIPLADAPRYPKENTEYDPREVYTEKLDFVKELPTLFNLQEKSIDELLQFKKFLESLPENIEKKN